MQEGLFSLGKDRAGTGPLAKNRKGGSPPSIMASRRLQSFLTGSKLAGIFDVRGDLSGRKEKAVFKNGGPNIQKGGGG